LKWLHKIDRTTPIGKRDYAVILLSIGTGLRSGDIINLKLIDFDWKGKSVSIVQGKTKKPVKFPINGQICNAVSDYILYSRPKVDCPYVFVHTRAPYIAFSKGEALGDILDRLCRKAGIGKKEGRSFHSLRRTFGTWLAAEEVDLTMIFQMLGQEKMDSSKPYLSFNDTQIFSCAMGFDDIPLNGGVYSELH
jgi:integrase